MFAADRQYNDDGVKLTNHKADQNAANAVLYEWTMFKWVSAEIERRNEAGQIRDEVDNLLLEGLLLHTRILKEFLQTSKTKRDDILAAHFLDDAETWNAKVKQLFPRIRDDSDRLNKKLAHLSYRRLEMCQSWDVKLIYCEINDGWNEFIKALDPERREWFVKE